MRLQIPPKNRRPSGRSECEVVTPSRCTWCMTKQNQDLWSTASAQRGVVTFDDLARYGIRAAARATLLRRRLLRRVGRRTFAVVGAPDDDRQRVMIACLDAGGVATEGTAAWLHGIGRFGPGRPPTF